MQISKLPYRNQSQTQPTQAIQLGALALALSVVACGGSGGSTAALEPAITSPAIVPLMQSVDGWAATGTNNLGPTGTTGGASADAAHTTTVTNRLQFIKALYPDAVIASDGSFTSAAGPSKSAKLIYIDGTIDLNVDANNTPIAADSYLSRGACLSTLQASYPSVKDANTFWVAYKAAYAPNAWNTTLVGGKPAVPSGPLESARSCASGHQTKVVRLNVGSNTSIIGKNSSARLLHGNLVLGTGQDNILIRNLHLEDAFDYWPAWDPSDSFPTPTTLADAAGCSTAAPTKCVGGRWNSNYDLISISGATHVWIDHTTLSDGENSDKKYPPEPSWNFGGNAQIPEQKIQHHDGLVDVNLGSHYVTLSFNHFKDHDKTGLVGGTDSASLVESPLAYGVTYHHNFYENNKQRQPRVRFGRVHVYNNYFKGQLANLDGSGPDYPWSVAWTAGTASKFYLENNVVEIAASPLNDATPNASRLAGASTSPSNYTKCTAVANKTWTAADCATTFYDSGNLLNGEVVDVYAAANLTSSAQVISNEKASPSKYWQPSAVYHYTLEPATTTKSNVLANAGVTRP